MSTYALASKEELSRLAIQAKAWQPATAAVLETIGVASGAACLDLGCGAMGILPLLSPLVGPEGRVYGVERDPQLAEAARLLARVDNLQNVQIQVGDAFHTTFDEGSFDLVHARFLLPHVPNPPALIAEMLRLTKPGGVVLLQEPDHSSWNFHPALPAWSRLIELGERAFDLLGIDMNIGRRTFQLLRQAGAAEVQVSAAVVALQDQHPYMRMALTAVGALRGAMLQFGLTNETELDALASAIEEHIARPDTIQLTFTTTQVWGRRPC